MGRTRSRKEDGKLMSCFIFFSIFYLILIHFNLIFLAQMYKRRTEEAKKDYLQQLALYRASLISSQSEQLFIHTNHLPRSPPYNRSYSGQQVVKTHNVSPPVLSSPIQVISDDAHQVGTEVFVVFP